MLASQGTPVKAPICKAPAMIAMKDVHVIDKHVSLLVWKNRSCTRRKREREREREREDDRERERERMTEKERVRERDCRYLRSCPQRNV